MEEADATKITGHQTGASSCTATWGTWSRGPGWPALGITRALPRYRPLHGRRRSA